MIRNKDVINCLPLLASVLGDRYGVEIRIGGHTACTDGKIIRIPALPIDCDKTALVLAKGYIDHESAHIRHTDFAIIRESGLDAPTRYLFNAIEDWRVEQRISAIYPGCRPNLDWLIRRFFVEDEARAGEKSPALAVLSYILLTVRSWDVTEVNAPRTRARDVVEGMYTGLTPKLDEVLDRVRHDCPDTAAALGAARELVQILRAFQPTEPEEEQAAEGGQDKRTRSWGNSSPRQTRPQNRKHKTRRKHKSNGPPLPHLTARGQGAIHRHSLGSLTAQILTEKANRRPMGRPAKEVMMPVSQLAEATAWARSWMSVTKTAYPETLGCELPTNSSAQVLPPRLRKTLRWPLPAIGTSTCLCRKRWLWRSAAPSYSENVFRACCRHTSFGAWQ